MTAAGGTRRRRLVTQLLRTPSSLRAAERAASSWSQEAADGARWCMRHLFQTSTRTSAVVPPGQARNRASSNRQRRCIDWTQRPIDGPEPEQQIPQRGWDKRTSVVLPVEQSTSIVINPLPITTAACSLDAGSLASDQSGSGQPEASLHGPPPSASVASFPQSDQSGQADGGTISIRSLVLNPSACRPPANHVPCVPALCASLHLASRPMHPTGWPCIGRLRRAA